MNKNERDAVQTLLDCLALDDNGDWFTTDEASEMVADALDTLKGGMVKPCNTHQANKDKFLDLIQNMSCIKETLKFMLDELPFQQVQLLFRAFNSVKSTLSTREMAWELYTIVDSFRLLPKAIEHLERIKSCK